MRMLVAATRRHVESGTEELIPIDPPVPDTPENRNHLVLDTPARLPEGRWVWDFAVMESL